MMDEFDEDGAKPNSIDDIFEGMMDDDSDEIKGQLTVDKETMSKWMVDEDEEFHSLADDELEETEVDDEDEQEYESFTESIENNTVDQEFSSEDLISSEILETNEEEVEEPTDDNSEHEFDVVDEVIDETKTAEDELDDIIAENESINSESEIRDFGDEMEESGEEEIEDSTDVEENKSETDENKSEEINTTDSEDTEASESEMEDTRTTEDNREEIVSDVREDEIVENENIVQSETDSENGNEDNGLKEEESNDIKIDTIKEVDLNQNNGKDKEISDFMINSFNRGCREVLAAHPISEIESYLNNFKDDKKYKEVLSDTYSSLLLRYSDFIDFKNDENAVDALWVLTAGKFIEIIERDKSDGIIKSEVSVVNHHEDSDIIEDAYVEELRQHKREMNNKYESYKLDRTVFAIADEEEEDESSVFDDKRTLEKDFFDSPFYDILKEVMETDRIFDMSKVRMKVTINADSSYIPIVDFSSGIRLVCIDTRDVDQYRMHPMMISKKIPFAFGTNRDIRIRMLYSDACLERPTSIIFSLKKIIAFEYMKPRYKVTLANNYVIAYTTENKYIDMFENGDLDSKMPENSIYTRTKPMTKKIGIIALDKKSNRDRQAMRRNQVRNDMGQEQPSVNDYNIHFILSAGLICNDKRLRDPTIPQNERYVEYIITQYNECNPCIIRDGLQTICACIIKEHYAKYGRQTKYAVEFEYDRAGLVSPSILNLIDNRDGLEPSEYRVVGPMEINHKLILPPSRLKMEGTFEFERGRVERRWMQPSTITKFYNRELYSNYDLYTTDGLNEFLRSRGFEEFWEPAMVTYDIMPYALRIIETDNMMNDIHKISLASLSDRNSIDKDSLMYEQEKLEYFKKLDKQNVGGFQRFLFSVIDMFINGDFNQ